MFKILKKNRSENRYTNKGHHWGVENIYYISRFFYKNKITIIALLLKYLNILIFRAYIPPQAKIGKRLELPHGGFGIVIHNNVVIGNDAIILHNVTIGNGSAKIGNRVYIGTGAIILGNIEIGDDVVIGANVTLTVNVPSNSYVSAQKGKIFENIICHSKAQDINNMHAI